MTWPLRLAACFARRKATPARCAALDFQDSAGASTLGENHVR
jgi:hypothetical protein